MVDPWPNDLVDFATSEPNAHLLLIDAHKEVKVLACDREHNPHDDEDDY